MAMRFAFVMVFQPTSLQSRYAALSQPNPMVWCCRCVIVPSSVAIITLLLAWIPIEQFQPSLQLSSSIIFGTCIAAGASVWGGLVADHFLERYLALHGSFIPAVIGGVGFGMAGPDSLSGTFATNESGFYALAFCTIVGLGTTLRVALGAAAENPCLSESGNNLYVFSISTIISVLLVLSLFLMSGKLITVPELSHWTAAFVTVSCAIVASTLFWLQRKGENYVSSRPLFLFFVFPLAVVGCEKLFSSFGPVISLAFEGIVVGVVDGMLLAMVFILPLTIGGYLGNRLAGIAAAALTIVCAYCICVFVFSDRDFKPGVEALTLSLFLLVALAYILYFLTYPLLLFWNFLLWRIAVNESLQAPRLLSLNTYVWNDTQPWPTHEFVEHLALVLRSNRRAIDDPHLLKRVDADTWNRALIKVIWYDLQTIDTFESLVASGTHPFAARVTALPFNIRSLLLFARQLAELDHQGSYAAKIGFLHQQLQAIVRRAEELESGSASENRLVVVLEHWSEILEHEIEILKKRMLSTREIDNPYIVGVPILANSSLFVGRREISARIEALVFSGRRTPILIYGQRRIGKTSLLKSMPFLLPNSILPLFVDLQGPVSSARNESEFCDEIVHAIRHSARRFSALDMPGMQSHHAVGSPWSQLSRWFESLEYLADSVGRRLVLIAFDELESLLQAFDTGRIDQQATMGFFRHLMQHHESIKLIFASAKETEELSPLASALINLEAVQLSCLEDDDTRQLITQPTPGFNLRYAETAVRRIVDVSSGHPALLQILCSSIVDLKNAQTYSLRECVSLEDVNSAIVHVIEQGALLFFLDFTQSQLDDNAAAILNALANSECQTQNELQQYLSIDDKELNQSLVRLCRRDILVRQNGNYQFRVKLVRFWFMRKNAYVNQLQK